MLRSRGRHTLIPQPRLYVRQTLVNHSLQNKAKAQTVEGRDPLPNHQPTTDEVSRVVEVPLSALIVDDDVVFVGEGRYRGRRVEGDSLL